MAFGLGTFGSSGLGDMLSSQVGDETDELRKKRLQDMASLMGGMGSMGGDSGSVFGRFDQFAQLVSGMGRGIRQRFGGGGFMR
jgi:hypothetical protein